MSLTPIGNDETFRKFTKKKEKTGLVRLPALMLVRLASGVAGNPLTPLEKYFIKRYEAYGFVFPLWNLCRARSHGNGRTLHKETVDYPDRFGVMVSSGIGGFTTIRDQVTKMNAEAKASFDVYSSASIVKHGCGKYPLRVGAKEFVLYCNCLCLWNSLHWEAFGTSRNMAIRI